MSKYKDITGQTFGRLTVIGPVRIKNKLKWECQCSCGNTITKLAGDLNTGRVNSCGCLKRELLVKKNTTHGMSSTKEYKTWSNLIQRCTNPNNKFYSTYKDRGVCEEWIESFEAFYNHIGKAPKGKNVSIERIDNNLGYVPNNVKWCMDPSKQSINQGNRKDNTSGVKGVSYVSHIDKWQAYIQRNKVRTNLGYFSTKEEAIEARKQAEGDIY